MSARAESFRYERKFLVPGQSCVDPGLRLNPGIFSSLYHPRFVNNIYLDSPELHSYFRSAEGAAERIKVRIRWYGELFGAAPQPVLEFKSKHGLLGRKESLRLGPLRLDGRFTATALKRMLQESDVPPHARRVLSGLEPTLVNRYQRRYYQSADRKYRLTLDSNLEFFRLRPRHNVFLYRSANVPFRVLELKYDQAYADEADEITGAFPFRMTKMSKYTYGLDCLEGH